MRSRTNNGFFAFMRVLVVPDKFKGTLRAAEAARAIARGWNSARPEDALELLPMSDGGDGFGEILGTLLEGEPRTSRTVNAAHEPVEAQWWWSEHSRTAIVESANVIGLAMLLPNRFHPFELDTLGLGQLLLQIGREHPNCHLIIGIGGSATNDGGFGLARGLGYRFLNLQEYCLGRWTAMDTLLRIRPPESPVEFREVTIATDVQNRLLGPEGATRIYGPQKGLRAEDFPHAEKCLNRLTEVVRAELGRGCEEEPGTGAAGGLGYGLRVFLDGRFEPGFDIFARFAKLEEKIAGADLVITGEGAIDAQTGMGKGTGAIAKRARDQKKRCIGLGGSIADGGNGAFDLALAMTPELTTIEQAVRNPAQWLEKLAAIAAKKAAAMLLALGALSLAACQSSESAPAPAANSAESRAVQFLAREVPAWSRDNGCYSCHNNGDGARALAVAAKLGHPVPSASLADTRRWLEAPGSWDENKGDPGFSDQRLADIQFAATLFADERAGNRNDRIAAAGRVARRQSANGAWNVEPENPIGSPVTYGTTLATYMAWRVVSAAADEFTAARAKAEAWLDNAPAKNIPAAAALLLYSMERGRQERAGELFNYLKEHQLHDGGWGPYPLSPPEVFDTALALLAVEQVPGREAAEVGKAGRKYLLSQQLSDGSWPPTTRPTGGASYAQQISTTAWAALALLKAQSER